MFILLVFAVWFSPGDPDVVRAFAQPDIATCEQAKTALVEEAAKHGHKIDARCITLKAGSPT